MKTTRQIYDQHCRIDRLLCERERRLCRAAHPETDGHGLCVHNWGNAAAKAVVEECYRIRRIARLAFDRLYNEAEHRRHGDHFRPLWCEHCRCGN